MIQVGCGRIKYSGRNDREDRLNSVNCSQYPWRKGRNSSVE